MRYVDKQIRKGVLGEEDYKKTFEHPTILLESEDYKKVLEFKSYCFDKQKCLNCGSKYTNATKDEQLNLILECGNCLSNTVLSDKISRGYIEHFIPIYENQGSDFLDDGFPILPEFKANYVGKGYIKLADSKIKVIKKK